MTALRELAELRELVSIIADWKLPETGETWPSGGPVSYATMFGSLGVRDYMRNIATKALAILDAEGDGGAVGEAVAWQYRILDDEEGPSPYWRDMTHQQFEMFRAAARPRYELRQLYTRPARSGVVRDEEMNRCERLLTACACHADFKDRDMVDPQCRACDLGVEVIDTFRSMRAALANPTRDAERLKEIVRRAEKITGSRCVRFEVRFDPLSGQGLNLIDYIDAAIQGERHER